MPQRLRIGTRDSALALWQARFIQTQLRENGLESDLVPVKSDGEADLTSPLYEMGVQGIFTAALDTALLNNTVDLAVHSLKDVPTMPAEGLIIAAIPARADACDVMVFKATNPETCETATIATSSLRRSAQWKHRYPRHQTAVIRGNINTRLRKLNEEDSWHGALFAAAGIERIGLKVPFSARLDWMIPAPAQGALAVVIRENDSHLRTICRVLDHANSRITTTAERSFLRRLMGGCSMPIGAYAEIKNDTLFMKTCVLTRDGSKKAEAYGKGAPDDPEGLAQQLAQEILENGGREIIATYPIKS